MTWSDKPDVPTLLDRERALLDQIFGGAAYEIERTDPNHAQVRSSSMILEVGYDPRDRSIESQVTIIEPWGEELDTPQGWARFLGLDLPPLSRNKSGHVTLGRQEQLRDELNWVARLSAEIFSDPQKTRDSMNFVRGYRAAYNDWASGAWDCDGGRDLLPVTGRKRLGDSPEG